MNDRRKIPKELVYVLIIFIILLGLNALGVLRPVRGLFEKSVILPLKQKLYDWQRFSKKDPNNCQLNNERQIAELKTTIASLTEENLSQKKLLSANVPKNWQFFPVKVIESKDEELTISLGRSDGVKEEMLAIFENTFLGRVDFVSESLAKIKMASFIDQKMAVKIISKDNQSTVGKGLLVGRGTGKMKIEQIFSSEEIKEGNIAVVETEGGSLVVGEITEVMQNISEPFKSASVKLLYNPEELGTIFLLKGKI